jgi:phosphatidylserine/phosphatidylglycerophosphate/cardiolipin synthase-like enzyme
MTTNYIGPIRDMLQQNYPQPSALWNFSADNQLAPDWLYATPANVWGQTYSQFKQAVAGSGPLELQTCTTASGPTQLCQAMDASMTAPGQTPQKLLTGHSDGLVDAIYDVMTSAEVLLDVTMLTPPTGRFLDAFKNALQYLSHKPDGKRPVVRILYSNPWPDIPPLTAGPFLQDITSHLDPARGLEIYVYVMSSSFSSWNHAKIVAADGARAIVGGHNMWGPHYLGRDPVFDVSMRLTGTAARHAQDFANGLWAYGQWRRDHLPRWISDWNPFVQLYQSAYRPAAGSGPSQIQAGVLPAPAMYGGAVARFPAAGSSGSVPVLSVGRGANTQSTYLLPTPGSYLFPFTEPGDEALVKLVSLAATSVRMSLQSFRLVYGVVAGWNPGLLNAIADALSRGVNIDVVISNPGAVAGGLTALTAPYDGDQPSTVNAKVVKTIVERLGSSRADAEQIVAQRLRIAAFRYSSDSVYPGNVPLPNHAKTVMVDDSAFYIGSQNMYSSNLNEFGYIVEDSVAARSYLDSYWTPLWNWSGSTVTSSIDADVETSEQVEAMQFIMTLQVDALLNLKWSSLLDQHSKATGDAAKSAIEESMDELIASAGFGTTSATVLEGLQQPFFTETPPSTEPTPEALRFVANLMSSPPLMVAFDKVVLTPAASVDAYNAAINSFLRSQGYSCTALEVLAAFSAMRDKTLAYWSGSYTTWLTDDGGICYANSSDSSAQPHAAQPHAAQPHAAQPRAAADAAAVPALGPLLVVDDQGVTFDGVAVAKFTYDDNVLTWSSSDGNATSALLQFGTVTRATFNDNFTGAECFGAIAYASAGSQGGPGTYSLYGRVSGSPGGAGSADRKSYTLAYVLGALGVVALLAMLGLYRFVSSRRQQDSLQRAQDDHDSDRDVTDNELEIVASPGRVQEASVIGTSLLRRRVNAGKATAEEMAPYESSMTVGQRRQLSSSVRELHEADTALLNPSARTLPDVVQTTGIQLDATITSLSGIFSSVGSELSAQSRKAIEESTRLADDIGTALDGLSTEQEEGEPFKFELED